MGKHITTEDISAYLDGESKRPERIRQHLQRCAECARRHVALSKLSTHLRALEAPEVRLGFAGRVLATIEDSQPLREFTWRIPVGVAAGAAAALMLVATLATVNAPRPLPLTPAPIAQMEIPQDEAALLFELEQRLAQGASSETLMAGNFVEATAPAEDYASDLLLALADPMLIDSLAAEWSDSRDYQTELDQLDASEVDVFRQLLADYARKAVLGDPAQEG